MLYIFGGLPGVGKTTLSLRLARELGATHLRIDTIENALRNAGQEIGGPEGYLVAYAVAADNLRLGRDVIADSVNPLPVTRDAWRGVAERCRTPYVEIEVVCSGIDEHRRRVETRATDVPRLRLPTWKDVTSREYEPWDDAALRFDTVGESVEESFLRLRGLLKDGSPRPG